MSFFMGGFSGGTFSKSDECLQFLVQRAEAGGAARAAKAGGQRGRPSLGLGLLSNLGSPLDKGWHTIW